MENSTPSENPIRNLQQIHPWNKYVINQLKKNINIVN